MNYKILAINPGSTSTKIAVFENEKMLWEKNIKHLSKELEPFKKIYDQFEFRKKIIREELQAHNYDIKEFSAVVGRGGLLRPISSGTYIVNEQMLDDLKNAIKGEHASNLGAILAHDIGADANIPAFIVDPVVVDELEALARYSGLPEIERVSVFHALNVKQTARRAAKGMGKPVEELNFVIAHMGGGITVNAIRGGRAVNITNGLDEGAFTPERAGGLPTIPLVELALSGKYLFPELKKRLLGQGGLVSYLETNDAQEVEKRILSGDVKAKEVYEAMAYQISQCIGAMATVLKGEIDGIILTGGLAYSKMLIDWIYERVSFIANVIVLPGENEMDGLCMGALRVLNSDEKPKSYEFGEKAISV